MTPDLRLYALWLAAGRPVPYLIFLDPHEGAFRAIRDAQFNRLRAEWVPRAEPSAPRLPPKPARS